MEATIEINGVVYKVKKTFRSLMKFEEMTGKSVYRISESINDMVTLFYCVLKVNNINFDYSLDEFIDLLDENEDSITLFSDYLQKDVKNNSQDIKKKKSK